MLAAFTAGLLLITISELGDKTFFIAMILAMRHPRRLVFAGAVSALAAMTVLSVLMGQTVALLPKHLVDGVEIALFFGFGFKLLYDASRMGSGSALAEQKEAEEVVDRREAKISAQQTNWMILTEAFVLTFLAEWGDRTQIATLVLAASNNPYGVTAGAVLGHAICAAIAVIGGRYIAGHISERTITTVGGVLFLIFGIVAAIETA